MGHRLPDRLLLAARARLIVDGQVRHDAGVTDVPGLYFLGLPWQTCRGSALLGFVGADAAVLSARLAAYRPARVPVGAR